MFYTYVLKSEKSGRFYIGSTEDLEKRIRRHNSGGNLSTRSSGPWRLIYKEVFPTKNDAYRREMKIKSYKGGAAFKNLLERRGG